MNNEQEISVRLDANGEVDTAYYIALAKQQRSEEFAGALQSLKQRIQAFLSPSRLKRLDVHAYS